MEMSAGGAAKQLPRFFYLFSFLFLFSCIFFIIITSVAALMSLKVNRLRSVTTCKINFSSERNIRPDVRP